MPILIYSTILKKKLDYGYFTDKCGLLCRDVPVLPIQNAVIFAKPQNRAI